MTKFIGRLCNLGINKESSRGVGEAATYWLPKALLSFDDKVIKTRSALSYGSIGAHGNESLVAQKWAEGSIEGDIFDKSFGFLLLAAFGTVTPTAYLAAYKHTFSLQEDNQHDSLTFHIDEPGGDLIFELAMLENLEINLTPEDVASFRGDFKSKSSQGSVEAASFTAEHKFLGRHATLKIASLTGDLDAASAISIKSLRLTINKNLVRDHVLGTVQPEDILNRAFMISGEVEISYENRTYANYMLDGTYKAMRIDIVNTDIDVGNTNPAFRLDLSRVDFDSWEPARPNDEVCTQRINFYALYDTVNGNIINDCYLVNNRVSY